MQLLILVSHLQVSREVWQLHALETEGVTKVRINRGIYVVGEHINIWGKPYMNMSVVRSSDINRTPDIRNSCEVT